MVRETTLGPGDLIWPLFVIDGHNERTAIRTMPGVERLSVDLAVAAAREAAAAGIPALALFPNTPDDLRSEDGREAYNPDNLMCRALAAIKAAVPDIGLIAGASGVMLMVSRIFMTWLLRHLTPWQLLIAGMGLLGLGFMGVALTTQFILLVASSAVIGLGQGLSGPMLNALIYEYAPSHETGEAMGVRTLINNVSQGTIPLIAGGVGAAFGLAPVFWGMAVSMLAMGWSSRAFWRVRPQKRSPAQ